MDEPSPALGTASCVSCAYVQEPLQVAAAPATCPIRQLAIERPEECVCANHPAHSPKRDRTPVGPVLKADACGMREVVYPSPDTDSIRRHLVDLVADVYVSDASQLSFREASAIWQAEQFAERRALVHLDRIRAALLPDVGRPSAMVLLLFGHGLFESVPNHAEFVERRDGTHYLEQFTLRGRVLLMASCLAGVVTFLLLMSFMFSEGGFGLSWGYVLGGAVLVGGLVLAVGGAIFRRLGIPFLASDVRSPSDSGDGPDPYRPKSE